MCLISSIEGFTEDSGEQRCCLICFLGYIKNAKETPDGLRVVTATKKILNFGTPRGSVLKENKLPIFINWEMLKWYYIYLFLCLRERNQGFVQVRQTLQLNCMSRSDYQFYRTKIFSLTWIFIRTNVAPWYFKSNFH